MALPFHTVGHSSRSLEGLVGLLQGAGIALLADVRRIPRSRANPQFNDDSLPVALAGFHIGYQHMAALGGLRGQSRTLPRELNGLWENESFHHYADYALGAEFQAGLARLREAGRRRRCAIMCAEAVWWRCHRRIVADYLIAGGETVFHIMGQGHLEPARMTPGAVVHSDGTVVYPAAQASGA